MLGILLMAVFYNRKNFLWSKYLSEKEGGDMGEDRDVYKLLMKDTACFQRC